MLLYKSNDLSILREKVDFLHYYQDECYKKLDEKVEDLRKLQKRNDELWKLIIKTEYEWDKQNDIADHFENEYKILNNEYCNLEKDMNWYKLLFELSISLIFSLCFIYAIFG